MLWWEGRKGRRGKEKAKRKRKGDIRLLFLNEGSVYSQVMKSLLNDLDEIYEPKLTTNNNMNE